eukprot:TRINITY_DN8166_c0_g2_i14.p1 TRINITY_DN8166_c0_g2~~TRINITY_DN8166_c0_g2_i14.p1  ORF type:complete len:113 (+),score=13.07 TRINITY_DN8166_c0_g2_i14:238-576(+)
MSFSSIQAPSIFLLPNNPSNLGLTNGRLFFNRNRSGFSCRANRDDNENDYLIDAPVSVGDGFSFSGGKYSDEPSRSDEWFRQGQIIAHSSGKGARTRGKRWHTQGSNSGQPG